MHRCGPVGAVTRKAFGVPPGERYPWERLPTETGRAYAAFREYRDAGVRRSQADATATSLRTAKRWALQHCWAARATAWDDEINRLEDQERLDALRTMHGNHSRAARALQGFAMRALQELETQQVTAADIARLFELGARLERLTLSQSVEELQGRTPQGASDDPWTRIANELAAPSANYSPA